MKRPDDTKSKKTSIVMRWLMMITIGVIITIFVEKYYLYPSTKTVQKKPSKETTYSDAELHAFWNDELKQIVLDQLIEAKLPYPELNVRYTELRDKIVRRTGETFSITMSTTYHWADPTVEAAVGERPDNTVEIILFIPALLDTFQLYKKGGPPEWRELYQTHIVITLMHEMEHTSNGFAVKAVDEKEELRAWAETCRYSIEPLVKKYGKLLTSSELDFYTYWQKCNGDTSSQLWRNALPPAYRKLDGLK